VSGRRGNRFTITDVEVGAARGTQPQLRFRQLYDDGGETTWQAFLELKDAAGTGRAVCRAMHGGRWWAGGDALGEPIGEWIAVRRGATPSKGRARSPII